MCIVFVNEKLPDFASMKKICKNQQADAIRNCWREHKDLYAFFGLKTVVNKKKLKSSDDQCHAHYLETKFKKSDLSL